MPQVKILLTDSTNSDFQKLASKLEGELYLRDGALADINREINKIDELPTVLVLYSNNLPIACGAFRPYDSSSVEIKRMYVAPSHRRRNLATQVLSGLEQAAKEMKFKHCILETGKNQPEAISLYTKCGYRQITNFGKYVGSANSICFSKRL